MSAGGARIASDRARPAEFPEAELALPEPLPPGEAVLWRGRPDWRLLAIHLLHVRPLAAATGLFTALSTVAALAHRAGAPFVALAFGAPLLAGSAAVLLSALSAWLLARVSRYTLTDARLVLRVGLIVPIDLNIPLAEITDVALRRHPGGSGDLALKVRSHGRMHYMLLWPHVRPFRFRRVEPMLRALPEAERAGEALVGALRLAHAPVRPAPLQLMAAE